MSNPSDGQLIESAQSGSREAFESLLRPLIGPACQLAFGILSDWQEAEDAVQEAAYKAWKHIGRLKPGTSTVRPWFFAIVRNQSLSVRRGRWFSLVRSPEIRLAAASAPDDEAARHVDLERALLGLKAEPPACIAAALLPGPTARGGGSDHGHLGRRRQIAALPGTDQAAAQSRGVGGDDLMDQGLESQGRQVRSVFERRIGRPRPGVEDRVLAGIQYDRQPGFPGRLGWLAIPVAVALAVLMVAGLLATRHAMRDRTVPAIPPRTKTSVAPPAFYFIRADQPDVLYGQSWGHAAMRVTPPVPLPKASSRNFALVSPDGSRFLIGSTVYDQSGMNLGSLTTDKAVIWADDSRHLWWMASPAGFAGDQGGPGRLMTWQPGESPREVATLGRFSGQSTASIRACSPAADQVVVTQNNVNRVGEVWVVKLSSGAVAMHETYPPTR